MHARRALLKKLASIHAWEVDDGTGFPGDLSVQTRNTTYRFRDGICASVLAREPSRQTRSRALVGMRIVGWLVPASHARGAAHAYASHDSEPPANSATYRRASSGEPVRVEGLLPFPLPPRAR